MVEHHCRICGLYVETPPWGENGQCPTYEYCPCCNVEFGYQDYNLESAKEFRKKWIREGMNWFVPGKRPKDWNKTAQLENIPKSFACD